MKTFRTKPSKNHSRDKRHVSLRIRILTILILLLVSTALFARIAAAPVLTQKIVLRDDEKAQRENVTVNQGETLSSCYIEFTPANVSNQAVTLSSSNSTIMTVTQHKGADGRTYQYKVGKNKMRVYNRSKAVTWRELK